MTYTSKCMPCLKKIKIFQAAIHSNVAKILFLEMWYWFYSSSLKTMKGEDEIIEENQKCGNCKS